MSRNGFKLKSVVDENLGSISNVYGRSDGAEMDRLMMVHYRWYRPLWSVGFNHW